jgi:hypothetical protein
MRVRLVYEVITDIEDKEKALEATIEALANEIQNSVPKDVFTKIEFRRKYERRVKENAAE